MSVYGVEQGKNTKYVPSTATVYVVDVSDDYIFINTSLNAVTVYLPNIKNSGLDFLRKNFYISDIGGNASTNNITILPSGTDTVNSGQTAAITNNNGTATCSIVNNSEYFVDLDFNQSSSGITGSLTAGYLPKASSATVIANSQLYDNGTSILLGSTTATPSAQFAMTSTSQGFLPPRMTTAQRNAISSPADGLWIYNTSSGFYNYWNQTLATWIQVDTSTGGDVSGSGTSYYLPMWTDGPNSVLGDSKVYQNSAGTVITFAPAAASSGSITSFLFASPAHTNQTAGANLPGIQIDGGSRQWATGAIPTQYQNYFSAALYTAVGASTITNSYGAFFEAATASTNITITNNYAAGFSGQISITANSALTIIGAYSSGVPAIWLRQSAPSTTNYFVLATSTGPQINSTDRIGFNVLDVQVARLDGTRNYFIKPTNFGSNATPSTTVGIVGNFSVTEAVATTGAQKIALFTQAANTGQTASTEISGFKFTGGSREWATGAITTQRETYFSTTTYTAVGASTITNAYGMYVEAPTASTNVTITNNYAAGFLGKVYISSNTLIGAVIQSGGEFVTIRNDQNAETYPMVVNATSGTAALSSFYVATAANSSNALAMKSFSAGFTTSGVNVANSQQLQSTGSAGLYIGSNTTGTINFYTSSVVRATMSMNSWVFTPSTTNAGAVTNFTFTNSADTAQTLSTNIPKFKITGSTNQWATGALATQYFTYLSANTVAFVGASTATSVYNLYVEATTAGTNATITNNYSAGFYGGGGVQIQTGSIGNQGLILRDWVSDATYAAIYGASSPTAGNSALRIGVGSTFINAASGGAVYFQINESTAGYVTAGSWRMAPPATTSGGILPIFDWRPGIMSGYTASTNTPMFKIASTTMTFATGALTTWYASYFQTTSINFVAASTITNAYGLFVEAPTAAGNATITNNWSLGTNGSTSFGATSSSNIHRFYAGTSTGFAQLSAVSSTYISLHVGAASPSSSNYAVASNDGNTVYFNGGTSSNLTVNDTARLTVTGVTSTGSTSAFTFSPANTTNQTSTANISGYLYNSYSRQWATGAIALQYEQWIKTVTYTAVGASTITSAFGMYVEAATASTNITITNNYAAGFSGNIKLDAGYTVYGETTSQFLLLSNSVGSRLAYNSNNYMTVGNTQYLLLLNGASQVNFQNTSQQIHYAFTPSALTASTASTELPTFKYTGASKQFNTGALTTQRFAWFTPNTLAFVGASTATDVYSMYIEATTAGTNATITNNWALGLSGAFNLIDVVRTAGAQGTVLYTIAAHTGQTASTEISNYKIAGAAKTWAAGAISVQRWNYMTSNTAGFASASTISDSYGLYVEAAVAGGNATITRNWALGLLGGGLSLAASTTEYHSMVMPSGTAPSTPIEGGMWNDSTQKSMAKYVDGVKQFDTTTLFSQTQTVTVANTVTETTLIGTGSGTVTLPANFFVAGKTLKIFMLGYHSSTGNPTITVRVKLGSTTVMTMTGASGNGSTDTFHVEGEITCRTTGVTGTVQGQSGYEELHSGGLVVGSKTTATTTIDTTASQALNITVEWGTAALGNTISATNFTLEVSA